MYKQTSSLSAKDISYIEASVIVEVGDLAQVIFGINAVKENLREGKEIAEVLVSKRRGVGRLTEILDMAREKRIPIRFKDRLYLDKLSPGYSHQGVIAIMGNYSYFRLDELIKGSRANRRKGLLLVADHITDAGNLGSLIRTAEFFGVHGLILPRDRSASISDTVHKRSAGGSAFLRVARVTNLARSLSQLNNEGLWIVGAAGEGKTNIYEFDWNRDLALVVGSEGEGLSNVVRDRCHHLVSIPRLGRLNSLNVSVAAGIILSEIVRQRGDLE